MCMTLGRSEIKRWREMRESRTIPWIDRMPMKAKTEPTTDEITLDSPLDMHVVKARRAAEEMLERHDYES